MLNLLFWAFLVQVALCYRCVNFYGLEVPQQKFVCSWKHDPSWYLDQMIKNIQINSVRIPYSYQYASSSDLEELDFLVDACSSRNLSVILDYHRGFSDHQGPSPVEPGITKDMWIDMLLFIAERFKEKSAVKAIGLFNEFQGFDRTEAEGLQREAVDLIELAYPERYEYMLGCVDWGKDCTDMWNTLPNNRCWIEIHSYGFAEGKLPQNRHKIFVGEFGWRSSQKDLFDSFKRKLKARRIKDICLWTLAYSSDTDTLYKDDCETVDTAIQNDFNSLFEWSQPQCLRGTGPSHQ